MVNKYNRDYCFHCNIWLCTNLVWSWTTFLTQIFFYTIYLKLWWVKVPLSCRVASMRHRSNYDRMLFLSPLMTFIGLKSRTCGLQVQYSNQCAVPIRFWSTIFSQKKHLRLYCYINSKNLYRFILFWGG